MSDKVALVTGGAVRVGKAIALALATQGYNIALHYNHSQGAAEQTAKQILELGVKVSLIQSDLSDSEQIKAMFACAHRELGNIDVLVNSAAIFPHNDTLNHDLDCWQQVMDLNLKAPLLLSQAFSQQAHFKSSNNYGHIINLLDARINKPAGDHLIYRMSKSALQHQTQCLAQELAPQIQVNGLALGAILAPPGADELHFARMSKQIPLKRTGSPQAVADAISFLISQAFITGAILPIDGGEFL